MPADFFEKQTIISGDLMSRNYATSWQHFEMTLRNFQETLLGRALTVMIR